MKTESPISFTPPDKHPIERAYDLVTGDEDARVCKDIPESACRHQPRNFFGYLTANFLGKIADEIASAKLTLPWLLGALGAPAAFAGFLVPIREAGVLLPQLIVAALVRHLPIRKGVWLLGAGLSAMALFLMAFSANLMTGAAAGWVIIGALVVFSLARGLCSVSAKDVLGKTVSKGRRGVLMGYSAGISGVATLGIGLYIEFFTQQATADLMTLLLVMGGIFWLLALLAFASINEQPGATEGGGNALAVALGSFSLLKTDKGFRDYVIARSLLLSVALAPPFYVLLAQSASADDLTGLGMLIIASGVASAISSPIWGKMGDQSSKRVMQIASFSAAVLGIALYLMTEWEADLLQSPIIYAVFFLALNVFHSGVRLGRKVYLVDLANGDNRATYVALSNTLIGIAMLGGGLIGILADVMSIHFVILLLSLISLAATFWIGRIKEVSEPD